MSERALWTLCYHFLLVLVGVNADLQEVWCPEEASECPFTLIVDYGLTMMNGRDLVKSVNGHLHRYDVQNLTEAAPIPIDHVITADGYFEPRLVMTFNGTIPGPALHVTLGQKVKMTVINRMMHETTTVHIHGQEQRGSPYSDGVPFVTQCPILPGQTFVQNFRARPEGTFFYHSHSGPQMTNGLYGPFIVHPVGKDKKQKTEKNETKEEKNVLEKKEHILVLQDWNHDWDSNMVTMKMRYGFFGQGQKIPTSKTLAGINYSAFKFQSGIINGRGRFYDEDGQHNAAPLSKFTVTNGRRYRFRLINSGDVYPFRVSIDHHPLNVVASDGHEIIPVTVESLIIHPGERFDFVLNTDQPVGNYGIRGKTLEVGHNHTAEAILHYDGAADVDEPISRAKECTSSDPCIALNCPFLYYPEGLNINCLNFEHIRSLEPSNTQASPDEKVTEYFLNFAFPGIHETPGSVNGKSYVNQPVASLTQPLETPLTCSRNDCGDEDMCHCPYSISYNYNDLVQLVFLNMGTGQGWDHPVHMHGHAFQVVKIGYPTYNETTGKFIKANEDIDCGHKFCNNAKWVNASWNHGNIPDMELEHAPLKDNIVVPSGGYVVVRFRADNPGLWIIHCHLELHLTDGMAALMNESFPLWPAPPSDFPTCHNFYDIESYGRELQQSGPR